MKSITLTKEAYDGISADAEAFTIDDEKAFFDTQDIHCIPAILATLKGLRAAVPVTAVAIKDKDGDDITTSTLDISDGEELMVHVVRTPAYSTYPITWSSADATKVKVTAQSDSAYAKIEPVAAGESIVITATGSTGITDTISVTATA